MEIIGDILGGRTRLWGELGGATSKSRNEGIDYQKVRNKESGRQWFDKGNVHGPRSWKGSQRCNCLSAGWI